MKKWGVCFGAFLAIGIPSAVFAFSGTSLLTDTFNSTGQVDLTKTTANVDTSDGWVELYKSPLANAIAAQAGASGISSDILVAETSGVDWYTYDQATNSMIKNTALGTTSYTDPLGVSLLSGTNTYYVFGKDYVHQVMFDGTGAVDNPLMAATGLSNLVSVSAVSDTAFASADSTGNVTVYSYDSSSNSTVKDAAHSFSTGLQGIVSVKNLPGTWNFVVSTKTSTYQYDFDQSSGQYLQNPAFTVTSGGQTVAADASDTGDLVTLMSPSSTTAYMMDQSTGSMSEANMYSIGGLVNPIAVSMPSDTSTVIASLDGTVNTYQYDQSSNTMQENPSLQIKGLQFNTQYDASDIYQSVAIGNGQAYNLFKITPNEQDDPGTSISYALSVDGGNTFSPITPNTWTHLPSGSLAPNNVVNGPYVVQATLNSSTGNATPRLTDIELDGYLDNTPPTAPGTPTANPNPSYQNSNSITWTAATDDTGIATYFFRYSTDGGNTWTSWTDTQSAAPGYTLNIPVNTEATYEMQVKARDLAGNDSPVSGTGSFYVDTKPLGIVPTPTNGSSLTVTDIVFPSSGQASPPTDTLPVQVEAGGEVTYQITTTGHAQSVVVTYSDGLTQTLYPQSSPSDPQDTCVWVGYYYPSSSQSIPVDAPQGENISITDIQLTRPGSQYDGTSPLLTISGSIAGNEKYVQTKLTQ